MQKEKAALDPCEKTDPLKTLVEFDLLSMAMDLKRLKQNEEYWRKERVPKRPDGALPGEVVLQLAVFVVPIAVYILAGMRFGFLRALFGLPLYYGVFHLLERALDNAIIRKRKKEEDLDRGRYAFTKILGDRLGMPPDEVTLDVVEKMTCDFCLHTLYGRNMPSEKKDAIMRKALMIPNLSERLTFIVTALEDTRQFAPPRKPFDGRGNGGWAMVATGTAGSAPAAASNDVYYPAPPVPAPLNYATGLPMSDNGIWDVAGNVYGHGEMGGYPPEMSY
ncbi:hypothetical protein PCA31118_05351 [Pandoraea captiosa]|uniref:Transmembrane protein n=1 Tax=Pandoraea captiosa TaxID=2508302 RepID=A0A5E5AT35_9BURK|nr:hypothetical protein [Pandoraea captiosa]VVE76991.1 hypothetical protein PCA31118_05351 [Pandoraea captiosa]